MRKKFNSSGLVYGNYWGGGKGSYPAKKFSSDFYEDLIAKNENALKDGSLDSGMGYESLIGALLNIETIEIIEFEGKEFLEECFYLN
jgi:hypothetical protein